MLIRDPVRTPQHFIVVYLNAGDGNDSNPDKIGGGFWILDGNVNLIITRFQYLELLTTELEVRRSVNKKESSCQTPLGIMISGLFRIVIFLVVLVIFRYVADHTTSPLFTGFVGLLYANVALIIVFSIMFMAGDVFAIMDYPFNLPFPIFKAIGSVMLASFIISLLLFIDTYYALGMANALGILELILYPLVFLVVLVTGYIAIFQKTGSVAPGDRLSRSESGEESVKTGPPSCEDVGCEFRQMLRDLFRRIRDEINRK